MNLKVLFLLAIVMVVIVGCDKMAKNVVTPGGSADFELEHSIPVWMEVALGDLAKEDLITDIEASGYSITLGAQAIIDTPEFSSLEEDRNIKLFSVTLADLGFPNTANFDEIVAAGQQVGLSICPAAAGLYLRKVYTDQVAYDDAFIAMEPIEVSSVGELDAGPRIFWLSDTKLASRYATDEIYWRAGERFIFCESDMGVSLNPDMVRQMIWPPLQPNPPTDFSVTVGTFGTAQELHDAVVEQGTLVVSSSWDSVLAEGILEVSPQEETQSFVVATVAELGFPQGADLTQMKERAMELGLEFCSWEVGFQYRLQHEQGPTDWLFLAMQPISDRLLIIARDVNVEPRNDSTYLSWIFSTSAADRVFSSFDRMLFRKR